MKLATLFLTVLMFSVSSIAGSRLEVETSSGTVKGKIVARQNAAWLGIPYAEAPIGNLRFAPPQKKTWAPEKLMATKQPNSCMQLPDLTFGNFSGSTIWNPNTLMSEDCLYLNIHAPYDASYKNLPVVVWIYGGGFVTGSATLDVYDPNILVKNGNIIFVALQYRLGSHGFLYFGKDSGAPGNVGLLDQVMALEWVKENIAKFNGDPNKVTIMGESAGGNSVAYHMLSPLSKNLFNKAIIQSSGANTRWGFVSKEEAYKRSKALAAEVGCTHGGDEEVLDCLKKADSSKFPLLEYNVAPYTVNFFPFVPTEDGKFLTAPPAELEKEQVTNKNVPVLIGSNANEGFWSLMYYSTYTPNKQLNKTEKYLTFNEYDAEIRNIFSFYDYSKASKIVFEYKDKTSSYFNALDQSVADSDFVCPTENFAETLSKNGHDVYRYFYNHRSTQDPWPYYSGVKHGDELEFTFGIPLKGKNSKYGYKERNLALEVVNHWTQFIKFGNPSKLTYSRNSFWPKYTAPNWQYMNITDGIEQAKQGYFVERCDFWKEIAA